MKKIIYLLSIFILLFSCAVDEEEAQRRKEETYYLNEDFIIIGANEDRVSADDEDGNSAPVSIKIWLVQRLKSEGDSLEWCELSSDPEYTNDFKITKELWYNKKVGDILHFEYIRKDRFFKVKKGIKGQPYKIEKEDKYISEPEYVDDYTSEPESEYSYSEKLEKKHGEEWEKKFENYVNKLKEQYGDDWTDHIIIGG